MANRPAIAKTYLARSQNRFLLRTQATMGIQASSKWGAFGAVKLKPIVFRAL